MPASHPARLPSTPTSRSRPWSAWYSGCSSSWAPCTRCSGFSGAPGPDRDAGAVWARQGRGYLAGTAPAGPRQYAAHPAYAGIYAYGRSRTDPSRRLPGREHSGRVRRLDAGEWVVRIDGALPAYISVAQYERNLARMAANRARAESLGAPREGTALLGGLVVCGTAVIACRSAMRQPARPDRALLLPAPSSHLRRGALPADGHAVFSTTMSSPRSCRRWPRRRWSCRSPPPGGGGHNRGGPGSGGSAWNARISRCKPARRQYQLAEPENRLVVRQLEREWEAALADRARLGEEYQRYQRQRPARLSAAELAAINALADDIPALGSTGTTVADRKRLLRAVRRVHPGHRRRRRRARPRHRDLAGGHQTQAALTRPVARIDQLSYYPALTERIKALPARARGTPRSPTGSRPKASARPTCTNASTPARSRFLIRRLGLRARPRPRPPHRSRQPRARPMVAGRTGRWDRHADGDPVHLAQTRLDHRPADTRPPYRWIITADHAEVERLRALHQLPPATTTGAAGPTPAPPIDNSQDKEPDNHEREALRNSH